MLKVKVGAALDGSVQATFKALPILARQAAAQVRAELNKAIGSPFAAAPAAAKKDLDKVTAEVDKAGKKQAQIAEKNAKYVADIKTRYLLQEQRAGERAASAAEKAWKQSTDRMARSAASTYQAIRSGMSRVVGGVLQGAGVNFSLGGLVGNALSAQDTASKLSRKGFQEGQAGVAGQKQDPARILNDMRAAADATAHSTQEVGEAMMGFVNKSGDLDLARKMIGDIGMLANSTDADFRKLAEDAGVIALKMGDAFGGDQAKQINFVNAALRNFSAQGKLGAIDMEELASQLPKLAAAAGQFHGDPQQLLQTVGFLAQESAKAGGSGSAAQAATAVAALPRDLKKKANMKAFAAAGVDLFSDKGQTEFRDPLEVIKESIFKTKGSIPALGKMFQGSAVNRSVEGLRKVYTGAGGGAAGEKAVNEEIKKLGQAALSAATVQKDNADRLQESTAKAQLFQNRLEQIAGSMADRVLPALEKLAPMALQMVDSFGKVVAWAASNPGEAIMLAIVGSIGKAAIGEAIAKAMAGAMGGAGGLGGAAGALGMTLAVAAATIMVTDAVFNMKDKAVENTQDVLTKAQVDTSNANIANKHGGVTQEQLDALKAERDMLAKRVEAVDENKGSFEANGPLGSSLFSGLVNYMGLGGKSLGAQEQTKNDAQHYQELKAAMMRVDATLAGGIIVKNMPKTGPGGGSAPPTTNTGAPSP